jgi:putative tryptophan/tyrosine transport system substrate-binding protein
MRRREFIGLIGGAAVTWPVAARGQQNGRKRRIGLLMGPPESDADGQARAKAFRDALASLEWVEGRNVQLEYRWVGGDVSRARNYASELANLSDVIMANGTAQLAAAQRATKSVPVVFAQVSDPVGGGFVGSIAHPGENITGCTDFEYSFGVKWLEVLKRVAPNIKRAAVIYDPNNPNSNKFLPPIESAAESMGVAVSRAPVRTATDINRAIDSFANSQPAGLIVLPSVPAIEHRDLIFAGAVRHNLPAVYPYRAFSLSGGLASYGVDTLDMYRCAATYTARILKGERPANLPVQFATRFEFVINLKAAKAIGLVVPTSELLNATEVIE